MSDKEYSSPTTSEWEQLHNVGTRNNSLQHRTFDPRALILESMVT